MSREKRYARQEKLSQIRSEGQARLLESKIAIVGLGALGSVSAQQLARAGIGNIRLIDRDIVEWSNLQRQTLYTEKDAQDLAPKANAAAHALKQMNSDIVIEAYTTELKSGNIQQLLDGVDIIIDGTDNFPTRYLINEYSVRSGTPWIYGGAVGTIGTMSSFIPNETPCFACLFPNVPEKDSVDTCDTMGVLGTVVNIVASYQSTEAIKYLTGHYSAMNKQLVQMNVWENQFFPINVAQAKRADCSVCGQRSFPSLKQYEEPLEIVTLCGRDSVHISPPYEMTVDFSQLATQFEKKQIIQQNQFVLKIAYDQHITVIIFKDGRFILQGTTNLDLSRNIFVSITQSSHNFLYLD